MIHSKINITVILFLTAVLISCGMVSAPKVKAASVQFQNTTRLGGTDRFDTSVKIAKYGWKNSDNVVIADAQGNNAFADAVTGTSLAYNLDCPILLTNINSTPQVVKDEIKSLGVKNIYIMGGTGVVSKSQENSFKSNGYNVTRIAGSDRFETAAKAADVLNSKSKVKAVYIVPPDKFQYALIAAPYAARQGAAILFANASNQYGYMAGNMNSSTKSEISKLGVKYAAIVGSYNVVSYDMSAQLENMGVQCYTIHGTTPQSAAESFMNLDEEKGVSISSDSLFPDALSSSVLTAKYNYNPILVNSKLRYTLDDTSKSALIFGGTGAVSDNLGNYIRNSGNAKDISNAELSQLYWDSGVSFEDIMFSAANGEQLDNVVTGNDGKEYVPIPEQYDNYTKMKDVLLKYDTDEYVDTELNYFSDLYDIDGKIVVTYGNVGMSFLDMNPVILSRQNIDSNTIQVKFKQVPEDIGVVTFKFEDNRWKVSDYKWIQDGAM